MIAKETLDPEVLELIKKLGKVDDEEYLTFTWAGSPVCFWCPVAYPSSWDDHEDDCAGKIARQIIKPELLKTERRSWRK